MTYKKRTYRIIISGGGTGGHIYPALAIAHGLKEKFPGVEILFVGALGKMEMEKVPEAGFPIKGIWISGIQRKISLKIIFFPFKLFYSILQSCTIIKKFKPDIAVGVGGFASGPLLWTASWKKIPSLIQEQNSYAGITNKWLARHVNTICVAYNGMDKYFPAEKLVKTGNPVRKDILDLARQVPAAFDFFRFDPSRKVILVMGGSLGAKTINISVYNRIDRIISEDIQLIWQIGKYYYDDYERKLVDLDLKNIRAFMFLKEINLAYAISDVVISRAGALSVSELCVAGKPVVFVPSPNVAEDHQTKNAKALVDQNAALMITDREAPNKLVDTAINLLQDRQKAETLSTNIRKLALPDATDKIIKEIKKLLI